jgi:hypothetical protein
MKFESQPESKSFTYNVPQQTSMVLAAKKEVNLWGRGTGKSANVGWKMNKVQELMPRCVGAISGESYQQILTRTLPTTIEALERIGIYKDVDFVLGKEPPAKMKFESPLQPPGDYSRFMSWRSGTGYHLISQDVDGGGRGPNLSFIFGDEFLTQDKKKFEDEALAGNRGGKTLFGHVHLHHGWHLLSSMPVKAKANYILDYGNYYEEDGNPIWQKWNTMCRLQLKFIQSKILPEQLELLHEIKKVRESIQFYTSKEGILFTLANAFDNIENVGLEYIRDMYNQMTLVSFRIEMLNERINSVEQSFYKIREEVHLYTHYDYGYLDGLDFNIEKLKSVDSRQDGDVDRSRPLDMAIDFGAVINAIRIAQPHSIDFQGRPSNEYRFLKSIYVKHPQGLKDAAIKFNTYYQYHDCKEINLPYDHTAVGRDPVRQRFIDEYVKELTLLGWRVNAIYIGQTSSHHNRFLLWELLLRGDDSRFPKILFNRSNDSEGVLSMQLAGLKQGKNGFEKDKSSERSKTIPREQATDLSDAADTLVVWRFINQLSSVGSGFEIIGMP